MATILSVLASPFSSSSSKSSDSIFEYDIFLTLSDPKSPVRAYLENSLRDAGFTIFIDNQEAEISVDDDTPERCRIIMVIFTPELVESLWTSLFLRRLVNIRRRPKTLNKPVVPVFWGTSPRQIIEHSIVSGYLEEDCLYTVKAIVEPPYGFTLSAGLGDKKEISNLLRILDEYWYPDLANHQVGLQLRMRELLTLVRWIPLQVKGIVGIWGPRGIGKTTIARAIYNRFGGYFHSRSFLANINDAWEKDKSLISIRKQLLSDIFKRDLDDISDNEATLEQMDQVVFTSALIVLDDVNQENQLKALCRSREWFGSGCFVFITTRNKDILDHFAHNSYEMKKLDKSESLKLFSWHAFKKFSPTNGFENLSRKVIGFCEGLPLLLEVIGSLLYNRTQEEWKQVLNKLKGIQYGQIQGKLKISLDFLTNSEKDLFINIACFYVGQNKDYVTHLSKGSRFPVDTRIVEQSLVKIVDDKIHVHDLLQEIGREIHLNMPRIKYNNDVFLSFRGEDTRKSFTTHLYTALKQAGIEVFVDEERIERGENISSSLLQAIESSRISIIIFSKNYAGSSWCLQELDKIMECHETIGQEVLPIFYGVRPSEVRKQQNAFGKAWKMLITRPSTSKSKESTINFQRALIEAANLSGWDIDNFRNESELIDDVVDSVLKKLDDNKCLFVAHHPVGLESRIQDIIQFLSSKSNEVIIVGIWGMGGIGKTTIAKDIYNKIGRSFDGKSFLANVREVWKQDNGQVYLQKQLLSCILKTRSMPIPNVEMGKTLIKKMFCEKRVFVVLDDVNNIDQLKALCESRKWFGRGSRILITTRDERLLQILQVFDVYNVKEMDHNESIELFSWHAFKEPIPNGDFMELSRMVVYYCRGLPLALEIIGSYLFDRDIPYWESVLKKLQQIPNRQIYEVLKISYNGLDDQTEKDIFLDICCFFIGKDRSYATKILDGCGLNAITGITHLVERCLVKVVQVGKKYMLDMHDLIRDMGREIIREQSPEEPEKRTRLWYQNDVLDVLRNSQGTIAIKGLAMNMSRQSSLSLSTEAFKMMSRLRLLQLNYVKLVGNYGYLSKELRWLCWHGFPLEKLPTNLSLSKIVAIDLKCSNLKKVWKQSQLLEWLKILNLSHSQNLTETPDFSKLPYLEKLVLKDCPSLSMIHPSIGDLKHIILLNLKDCKGLNHLPRSIYSLKSLKAFILFGCSKIDKLEEDIEQMESLTILEANQTAITQVPFSLVRLRNIQYVSLCGYEGSTRDVFPSLILSWMPPTNPSLFQPFGIIPFVFKSLSHPFYSKILGISTTRPSTSQVSCRKTPALIGFHEQVVMERSKTLMNSLTMHVGESNKVVDALLKCISEAWSYGRLNYSFLGNNYPDWLVFENEGSSVSFEVPKVLGHCLKGMVLYITYTSLQDRMTSVYPIGVMINNFTKGTVDFHKQDVATTCANEEWKKMVSNLEPGNEVEILISFAYKCIWKKTTIYLVYVEETYN